MTDQGDLHVARWQARITPMVEAWWRQGQRFAGSSIREDLQQSAWVAILEGRIREDHWSADLHDCLRDAASVAVRGVHRGTVSVPWPWAAVEVTPYLRDRTLPLDEQVHLRIALQRLWSGLNDLQRLVLLGVCAIPGPPGPGSAGIPHAWAQRWGLNRFQVHTRLHTIRVRLAGYLMS